MARDTHDPIERAAELSVLRGVGFGTVAILCACLGLAGYPVVSLRLGAAATPPDGGDPRAQGTPRPQRPYKRTEAWLLLDPPPRLPAAVAQRLVGAALKRTFRCYARLAFLAAVVLWLASLLLRLVDGMP